MLLLDTNVLSEMMREAQLSVAGLSKELQVPGIAENLKLLPDLWPDMRVTGEAASKVRLERIELFQGKLGVELLDPLHDRNEPRAVCRLVSKEEHVPPRCAAFLWALGHAIPDEMHAPG